ncbi:MAG TPA: hypothetical protein VIC08_13390 [Cellvibrionaceae bacterium]
MDNKSTKASLNAATIEQQTAAFLKAGGAIEYVVKGKSGQIHPTSSKLAGSSK